MASKFELNDTTPVAPAGRVNVKWQYDPEGNVSAAVVDDTGIQRIGVRLDGAQKGVRSQINFVTGSNVNLAAADNPGGNWVDVAINANQTPWTSPVDAGGFALTNAGQVTAAPVDCASAGPASLASSAGALYVREVQRAGSQGSSMAASPRIVFLWNGLATAQLGMDTLGQVRTFNAAGTGYATFAAGQIISKQSGYVYADGTLQTSAACAVRKGGAVVATRPGINFIEGSNMVITAADDAANNRVNVTIGANAAAIQTPWTQNINGAQFNLSNAGHIEAMGSITSWDRFIGARGTPNGYVNHNAWQSSFVNYNDVSGTGGCILATTWADDDAANSILSVGSVNQALFGAYKEWFGIRGSGTTYLLGPRLILACPNTFSDAWMTNGSHSFAVDEGANILWLSVKYSNGAIKRHGLALT